MIQPEHPVIVGIGEVLWDIYPDEGRFGGAPSNFACHVASLGGHAEIVSSIGKDELGDQAIDRLKKLGVGTRYIHRDAERPTGTVKVKLNKQGQPSYLISADSAWDHLEWNDSLERLANQTSAVCFGTLGQRSEASRSTIRKFLRSMNSDSIRVLDVNLRQNFFDADTIIDSLELANVLKLNDDELRVVAAACELTCEDYTEQELLQKYADRFDLELIALTRGGQGATICAGQKLTDAAAVKVDVRDTVGAGDAFTAALVMGMIHQWSLQETIKHASQVAAFVCTQDGATPFLPKRLAAFGVPRPVGLNRSQTTTDDTKSEVKEG